jgi:hypothetical protein
MDKKKNVSETSLFILVCLGALCACELVSRPLLSISVVVTIVTIFDHILLSM